MIKNSSSADSYDCVVVGAGPAGSTTAALVAEAGHHTLLLEREKFPRFHVGESLMPETYWTLQRLGVLDKMFESNFERKVGVQFVTNSGKESQPFYFNEHDPRECSSTWHVERSKFDQILFDNASEKGADCRDATRVTDINLGNQAGDHKVSFASRSGQTATVKTQVIVDATGQSAMLANRLGLREINQRLKKASIWTYYRGAMRSTDGRTTTTILHTSDKKAWFWYIPLANDIVSVGVVADNDYLLKGRGKPQTTFLEELDKCDNVRQRVDGAEHLGAYHVAKEFSYTTKQHAGPGWVLVGDAFGFIDPIYSSGVFLALLSGQRAADAIIEGFQKNDLGAAQLGKWADDFKRGGELIRKLVHAFYTDNFSFGMFMREHPEHAGRLTDLLIGRVFEGDVAKIFDDLDPALQRRVTDS